MNLGNPHNAIPLALCKGEELHIGKYRICSSLARDCVGILYRADVLLTGDTCLIYECFPSDNVYRVESEVCYFSEKLGNAECERFRAIAERYREQSLPLLPLCEDIFEEHGTVYVVMADRGTTSLADIPITGTFIRSLALELCEQCEKVSIKGTISFWDLTFDDKGAVLFPVQCLFGLESRQKAIVELQNFLRELLERCEDKSDVEYQTLCHIFDREYEDYALLHRALLLIKKPKGHIHSTRFHHRTEALSVACILLLVSICLVGLLRSNAVQGLRACYESGLIQEGCVTVWVQLPEDSNEAEAVAMYERLARGFEEQYTGYGVELFLFMGDSLASAIEEWDEPVLYMNIEDESILSKGASLELLTGVLTDCYLVDMGIFTTSVPLGLQIPLLYSNGASDYGDYVELGDIPNTVAVIEELSLMSLFAERTTSDTSLLSIEGSRIVASTTECTQVQSLAMQVGSIAMYPILLDGELLYSYEYLCTVNRSADKNSQRIAMLWLSYLLTEQGQELLFTEHSGILPLHEEALQATLALHHDLEQTLDPVWEYLHLS